MVVPPAGGNGESNDDLWARGLRGFRQHGVPGKLFILLHSVVGLLFALAALMFALGAPRSLLVTLGLATCQLLLAAGVALHRRLALIVAFALSVVGFVSAFYGACYYGIHALRAPTRLVVSVALLALYAAFVRYFGRLQRSTFDAEVSAEDEPAGIA